MENKYKFIDTPDAWGKPQHLHTFNNRPLYGTSSALNVLSKPLTWWSAELAAVECLEAGEKIESIREEYVAACESSDKKKAIDALQKKYPIFKKARYAHKKSKDMAADKGTDRHEILERFCKGQPITETEAGQIKSFIDWSKENVKRFIFSEGHCYSEKFWLGGIADLLYLDNNDKVVLLDFKSSGPYISQAYQCAGYDLQIAENGIVDKDGNSLYKLEKPISYYVIFPFGTTDSKPGFFYDIEDYKECFLSALTLYKYDRKMAKKSEALNPNKKYWKK